MILSDAAIKNRTTVGVIIALIVLFGAWSYIELPREAEPDIPIPYIVVTTVYEGVSPEDVESAVTIKIEKELSGLKGLKELTSTSAEGASIITAEFLPDVPTQDALQSVRDKVELAKGELPEEAEEPVLTEINMADFPIMVVNISGDISPVRLKAFADDLEDVIESIEGVLNVDVIGGLEREVRIEVDREKLTSYGLTVSEILGLIPSENVNISAGGLETPGTKFNVRVPAEFVKPEEVNELPLAMREGRPILLADVASLRDTFKDRGSFSRLNEQETITLSIQKRAGAGIIEIVDQVKAILAEAERRAPQGVRFDVTLDKSDDIRMMVADLENNLLSGMILVVAVLLLFMGWRASLVVAVAIPLSMLLSFAFFSLLGYTINMVVLFSLIMALGMLVDNAIVIVENIYRHYELSGNRVRAAMHGTSEVAWPVITSTATTLAAFFPLVFWPGIMGGFMKWLPITLIITLSCSLFVALIINPVISSIFVKGRVRLEPRESWFIHRYRRTLEVSLAHPLTTLGVAVLLLVGLAGVYHRFGHGVELFPEADPRRGVIDVRGSQGANIHDTNALAYEIEERLRPFKSDLKNVITSVGDGGSGGHTASLTINFHDFEQRERPSNDVLRDIRASVSDLAGAEIKVEQEEEGPPTGAPVTVRLIGEDIKELQRLSDDIRHRIEDVPGLVNLRSDLEAARPEMVFTVDRHRAMRLGVNAAIIGNFLKTAIYGQKVGTYREFNDEYDITVRLPENQRDSVDELFKLRVPNTDGDAIPLSSLGEFQYRGGYGTILRVGQKRVVTLTADAEGRLGPDVLRDAQARLEGIDLPLGYHIEYAGEKEEQDEAQAFLSKAFVIALFLIVLILVMQFNTLIVPGIIMTTVLLSLIGVLVGLLVCSMPFGIIMTGVGVISLAGVVVNNAIVLLDYTRLLQARGMELTVAAVQAGVTRLRPVLLTATTTILGLIPMAVGVSFDFHKMAMAWKSESSQWWRSMAVAVIFGLAFATLLTLIAVPALYVLLVRIAHAMGIRDADAETAKA